MGHMDPVYSYQAFPSLMCTPVPKMVLELSIPVRYRIFPCWFDVVTTQLPALGPPASTNYNWVYVMDELTQWPLLQGHEYGGFMPTYGKWSWLYTQTESPTALPN